MQTKIEKELIRKLKVDPQGEDETRQAYLNRLVDDVQKLDDAVWEKFSEPTKDWTNAASTARTKNKNIPDFAEPANGLDKNADKTSTKSSKADKPAKSSKADKSDKVADKSTKGASDKGDKAPKKKKAAASTDEDGTPKKRAGKAVAVSGDGMSSVMFVRRYVIEHPNEPVDSVIAAVTKAGYKKVPTKVTVASLRSEMRNCIRVCNELGWFKSGIDLGI